jgi:uncharacterized protein (DUF2336 family)
MSAQTARVARTLPDPDESARVRLGANPSTPAAVMERLASDPAIMVRAALAMNPATPPRVNQALAGDADERIRALLARKLARLAPELSASEQDQLQRRTYDILVALVEDEAVRVRSAIADVIKQMPDAPRSLVLRLARDSAVSVSEPVIRFSPLLTPDDLIALLNAPSSTATAIAVARRPHLNSAVADVITASEDNSAIRALLENPSAQIRETALDMLVACAADHQDWHEPLVRRPILPPRSARALSSIVATHLLEVLASRADLDPGLVGELRQRLEQRLAEAGSKATPESDVTMHQALAEAHRLLVRRKLTEEAVQDAIRSGNNLLATALLAVAAGVPVTVVDRAASLRSAKGLISLIWKAGFSMTLAGPVQSSLAHLCPSSMLTAGPNGGFPLAVAEMRWQIDFLRRFGH